MNNIAHAEAIQRVVKPIFRGHQKLNCKVKTHHPANLEREYIRITNTYMKLVFRVVSAHLIKIKETAAVEREQNKRRDDDQDLSRAIREAFNAMSLELGDQIATFGLERKLKNLANLTRKLTIKEWKRVCRATLGIDILDDYYLGEFYREALNRWTEKNVNLIKSIPYESLNNMREIVFEGYRTGKPTSRIIKKIQAEYGVGKRRARLIARDQVAKLNADITRQQQTDAGVEEYVWSTSSDSRVRDRHKALNNKTFRWDDPPVVDIKTGRRAHPGEDYQCRCVALPKFSLDTLDLPAAPIKEARYMK